MDCGIDEVRKDFETINQSRSWTVEVRRSIDDVNSLVANGPQQLETRPRFQCRNIHHRAVEREPTASDHQHLGISVQHLLPIDPARLAALLAKPFNASRDAHQFRVPVPG